MNKRGKKGNNAGEPEYVLAYSTDPIPEKRCKQCLRPASQCVCAENAAAATPLDPRARIEKKGRGGKSVTVLYRLPVSEALLKDLCKSLKQSLGTGGTHYVQGGEGIVELQGDWREQALALVKKFKRG